MTTEEVKRVAALITAVLFLVGTALGIPISGDEANNEGQEKRNSSINLALSDGCEAEVKDIPVYGDISEQCEEELTNLHRRLHHIVNKLSKSRDGSEEGEN